MYKDTYSSIKFEIVIIIKLMDRRDIFVFTSHQQSIGHMATYKHNGKGEPRVSFRLFLFSGSNGIQMIYI
jgi:hypothetical protein